MVSALFGNTYICFYAVLITPQYNWVRLLHCWQFFVCVFFRIRNRRQESNVWLFSCISGLFDLIGLKADPLYIFLSLNNLLAINLKTFSSSLELFSFKLLQLLSELFAFSVIVLSAVLKVKYPRSVSPIKNNKAATGTAIRSKNKS